MATTARLQACESVSGCKGGVLLRLRLATFSAQRDTQKHEPDNKRRARRFTPEAALHPCANEYFEVVGHVSTQNMVYGKHSNDIHVAARESEGNNDPSMGGVLGQESLLRQGLFWASLLPAGENTNSSSRALWTGACSPLGRPVPLREQFSEFGPPREQNSNSLCKSLYEPARVRLHAEALPSEDMFRDSGSFRETHTHKQKQQNSYVVPCMKRRMCVPQLNPNGNRHAPV